MQEIELRESLKNTIKALREDNLSSQERDRRAEQMLPALVQARYAYEDVALRDEAKEAALASLMDAARLRIANAAGGSQSGILLGFLKRFRSAPATARRGRRIAWAGVAAAAVIVGVLIILLRVWPHS